MRFEPSFKVIDKIDILPLAANFKEEKLFYQSDPSFVFDNGGPIARKFIEKLPFNFRHQLDNVLVDQRIHKLQEGYYPAIPGWHLDWIPRTNKGQDIDLTNIPDYEHVVLIVGESSLTEFLDQPTEFPDGPFWTSSFSPYNTVLNNVTTKTKHVENGQMVHFTSRDWHRPSPALGSEWRMLIRASRVDHIKPVNQIRSQAQVYIPIKEASW
jgi:hypothetical protein